MLPRNPPPLRPLAPTGNLEDRNAALAIEEMSRKLSQAEARIAELERAAQSGNDSLAVEVPSLSRQGSKLMLYIRRLVFRERGLPQLSDPIPAGEVEAGGGGGGNTTVIEDNRTIVNNTYNSDYSEAMILTGGFSAS